MIIMLMIYVLIAVFQAPGLIKCRQWREFAAFAAFYAVSFALSLLYVLNVDIPSPMEGIAYIFDDVLHLKY